MDVGCLGLSGGSRTCWGGVAQLELTPILPAMRLWLCGLDAYRAGGGKHIETRPLFCAMNSLLALPHSGKR